MMGTDQTPPVSPAVANLLACERDIVPQGEMVRARMLARARESLQQPAVVPLAPRRRRVHTRIFYAAAAGVALMAGAAAAYQMLRQPEPAPTAPQSSPKGYGRVLRSKPAASPEPAPPVVPEATPPSVPSVEEPTAAPSRRITKSEARAEELRLLVRARRADARGDYPAVLGVLAEHERRHPTGRLAEEREVLRIKALVGLGRVDDARQLGATFHRQFPHSVLLHKVEDMLSSSR